MRVLALRAAFLLASAAAVHGTATLAADAANMPRFTEAEADAGRELYEARCAQCHGRALEGGVEIPALTGRFVANWGGRPVGDLHDYIARAMPQYAPASLTPGETSAVVAWILKANGYPAGAAPGQSADPRIGQMPLPPPGAH